MPPPAPRGRRGRACCPPAPRPGAAAPGWTTPRRSGRHRRAPRASSTPGVAASSATSATSAVSAGAVGAASCSSPQAGSANARQAATEGGAADEREGHREPVPVAGGPGLAGRLDCSGVASPAPWLPCGRSPVPGRALCGCSGAGTGYRRCGPPAPAPGPSLEKRRKCRDARAAGSPQAEGNARTAYKFQIKALGARRSANSAPGGLQEDKMGSDRHPSRRIRASVASKIVNFVQNPGHWRYRACPAARPLPPNIGVSWGARPPRFKSMHRRRAQARRHARAEQAGVGRGVGRCGLASTVMSLQDAFERIVASLNEAPFRRCPVAGHVGPDRRRLPHEGQHADPRRGRLPRGRRDLPHADLLPRGAPPRPGAQLLRRLLPVETSASRASGNCPTAGWSTPVPSTRRRRRRHRARTTRRCPAPRPRTASTRAWTGRTAHASSWATADSADGGEWWSDQIGMIERLLPHVRQYVRVRQALADAEALGTSLASLLENTWAGIIQLDWRSRIVAANDRASALLRQGDGLSDQGGYLQARLPADNARLHKLLARALPPFGDRGTGGSMTVRRSSGLPRLVLHLSPVADRALDMRARRVAALALVIEPGTRTSIDRGLVAEILDLTPSECEVAVLLAEGNSVRGIARATGRRESTVRWHIQAYLQQARHQPAGGAGAARSLPCGNPGARALTPRTCARYAPRVSAAEFEWQSRRLPCLRMAVEDENLRIAQHTGRQLGPGNLRDRSRQRSEQDRLCLWQR